MHTASIAFRHRPPWRKDVVTSAWSSGIYVDTDRQQQQQQQNNNNKQTNKNKNKQNKKHPRTHLTAFVEAKDKEFHIFVLCGVSVGLLINSEKPPNTCH